MYLYLHKNDENFGAKGLYSLLYVPSLSPFFPYPTS